MPYTPTQLYSVAQPGTTDTLLYTVPTGSTVIVRQITVANTTSTAATITLGLDAAAALVAANRLLSAVSVGPNETLVLDLHHVLNAAETIRALQGTASALTVMISGIVIT